jgi:hypothetical protein
MEFLKSNRFWAMITGTLSAVLIDPAFPTQPWYISLGKFLALTSVGFVGIRTIDRFGEKIG